MRGRQIREEKIKKELCVVTRAQYAEEIRRFDFNLGKVNEKIRKLGIKLGIGKNGNGRGKKKTRVF